MCIRDSRYHWAVLELEGFKHPQSVSERIHASYSLEKALLWCRLAESILKESNGTPGCTSEGALREISGRLIEAYRKAGDSGELLKAVDAYNAGRYGASLIEVAYYESSHNGSFDFSLNEYAHETDWGRMIYAHSLYINASSEYGPRSSLEVARLSLFTDMHLAEADRASCFMLEEWRREERDDSYAAARNTLLILAPILIVLLVLRRVFRDEGF